MDIDPWGDFEALWASPEPVGAVSVTSEDGVELYSTESTVDVRMHGFATRGYLDDGHEFSTLNFRPDSDNYFLSGLMGNFPTTFGTAFSNMSAPLAPKLNSAISASEYAWWLGRPSTDRIVEISSSTGSVGIGITFDNVTQVKNIELSGIRINATPALVGFDSASSYSVYYISQFAQTQTTPRYELKSIDLYVNGSYFAPVEYTVAGFVGSYSLKTFIVEVKDQSFDVPTAMTVEDVEFRLNYSNSWSYSVNMTFLGGLGIMLLRNQSAPVFDKGGLVKLNTVSGGGDDNTGLLNAIIGWLKSIVTAITELPGRIATAILDGLKGLFIPSENDFTELMTKYQTLLEERLGFVYQAGSWIVSFFQQVADALTSASDYTFQFPGIVFDMPGEEGGHFVLVEEQPVSLENAAMDVIRPVAGTIVSLVVVIAMINLAEYMFVSIVSGKSYFDFLKGGGET